MISKNIVNFTVNDKCSNCGECCTNFLPMSHQEIETIHKYLDNHPEVKEQRIAVARFDMTCPFHDSINHRCLIYSVRPLVCRQFLCNKSMQQLNKEKVRIHKDRFEVPMREEFFNNPEERRMFSELFNI